MVDGVAKGPAASGHPRARAPPPASDTALAAAADPSHSPWGAPQGVCLPPLPSGGPWAGSPPLGDPGRREEDPEVQT